MSLKINSSNITQMKINGYDIKLAKINGNIVFQKYVLVNLYNYQTASVLTAYIDGENKKVSKSFDDARDTYMQIESNTTYKITKLASARFSLGTSIDKPTFYTSLTQVIENHSGTEITITTGTNDKYLVIYYWHYSDTITEEEIRKSIVVTKIE